MQQHARRSAKVGAWPGERRTRAPGGQSLKCPRCSSTNTKFCYYNNYNLSQPRHFCKSCRRYWTNGGVLRNVPVGGGSRKPPKPSKSKLPSHDNPHPPLPLNFTTTLPSPSASDYSVGFCPTREEDKNVSETAGPPSLQVVQGQVAKDGDLVGSEWPGGGEAEFFELGAVLEQSYCWEGQSETLGQWLQLDQSLYSP